MFPAPRVLSVKEWRDSGGPNYTAVFGWRQQLITTIASNATFRAGAFEYYREHPVEFVVDLCCTFDPRNAGRKGKLTLMPFVMFDRQKQLIEWFEWCRRHEVNGLLEKSRDMGATWIAAAYAIWLWLFTDGASIGFGSRKQDLVDKLGDPDTIFEKIRIILKYLPRQFIPPGYSEDVCATYLRVTHPVNSNTISGEAGDNIGRGGRKLMYFVDEAAFIERPEKIEASLGQNTRVRIDISSPNGASNVFYRKRNAGVEWNGPDDDPHNRVSVFVMDWRDNPMKSQKWYDDQRELYESNGLMHVFNSEVNRSYFASVTNTLVLKDWVDAAVGFEDWLLQEGHICERLKGPTFGGQDVADETGGDSNALALSEGVCLRYLTQWGGVDTTVSAQRAYEIVAARAIERGWKCVKVMYDAIGVGAGIRGEVNRIKSEIKSKMAHDWFAWYASGAVKRPNVRVMPEDPNSLKNSDFFENLSIQAAWSLRRRFLLTYRWRVQGRAASIEDCISIDPGLPYLNDLTRELCQMRYEPGETTTKMKLIKKADGEKSPNLADAVKKCYFPVEKIVNTPLSGF